MIDQTDTGSNVALRKSANQSSTARGGSALNAIDGDRSVHHDVGGTGGRCSETNAELSPWWMTDMMRSFTVHAVRITTRSCCGNYTATFDLNFIKLRCLSTPLGGMLKNINTQPCCCCCCCN